MVGIVWDQDHNGEWLEGMVKVGTPSRGYVDGPRVQKDCHSKMSCAILGTKSGSKNNSARFPARNILDPRYSGPEIFWTRDILDSRHSGPEILSTTFAWSPVVLSVQTRASCETDSSMDSERSSVLGENVQTQVNRALKVGTKGDRLKASRQ